jgi:hypothetical protein
MIQRSVPFETTWILRILLLISVALISACENEDIIRPQPQTEPSEPPLPVSEWYPAPKHRQQPMMYAPVPAPQQQQPVMAPPAYQGNVAQQPWGIPAQQPVYSAPQVNQYQPSVWAGQQPAATWPQPVVPQYQYVPRPWGNVTEPGSNRNSNVSTETWPQGGYVVAPWGVPQSGGTGSGATAGQAPGTVYYSY